MYEALSRCLVRIRSRVRALSSQAGFTLVEVLASVFLLTIVVAPVMEAINVSRHSGQTTLRVSQTVALAQGRMQELTRIALSDGLAALEAQSGTSYPVTVTTVPGAVKQDVFRITTDVGPYPSAAPDPALRLVSVTVACEGCVGRYGQASPPIHLTSVLRRRLNGE